MMIMEYNIFQGSEEHLLHLKKKVKVQLYKV